MGPSIIPPTLNPPLPLDIHAIEQIKEVDKLIILILQ